MYKLHGLSVVFEVSDVICHGSLTLLVRHAVYITLQPLIVVLGEDDSLHASVASVNYQGPCWALGLLCDPEVSCSCPLPV